MLKTFRNLLLQNLPTDDLETWYWVLEKFQDWSLTRTFFGKVNYGKKLKHKILGNGLRIWPITSDKICLNETMTICEY